MGIDAVSQNGPVDLVLALVHLNHVEPATRLAAGHADLALLHP
ncbi:MAG: hypothetical protein WDO13_16515 [Verrucomicrobiota bacterium]